MRRYEGSESARAYWRMVDRAAACVAGIAERVEARQREAAMSDGRAHGERIEAAAAVVDEAPAWRADSGRLLPAGVARLEADAAAERQAERTHDEAMARMDHESRLVQVAIDPLGVRIAAPAYLALAGLLLGWLLAAAVVLR